ncbi:hypothetical protein, partial [Holdemania sp. 1001302B_160321_E10]|uniref:hypothetical protein n=1 Tax=Holdemania sp. 1001302B_160321_E10 TaxID=2787120 RepID=UPI001E42D9FA
VSTDILTLFPHYLALFLFPFTLFLLLLCPDTHFLLYLRLLLLLTHFAPQDTQFKLIMFKRCSEKACGRRSGRL